MKRVFTALLLCFLVAIVIEAKPVQATDNVIYGSSTGFPPDATIKQVSFARDSNDLVTTFQVQGKISDSPSHGYLIGIELDGPEYSDRNPYAIFFNSYFKKACFYENAIEKCTPIGFEIAGSTWTSRTPISLLDSRVHFWVWVGIKVWSGSDWIWKDFLPAALDYDYEIALPARLTVLVNPTAIASKTVLVVDGAQNNFDSNGKLSIMVDSGISHTVTITPTIQTSDDTRYVVGTWSDWGSGSSSRTLEVDQDTSVSVSYNRQFLLTASSEFGTASGGGWYDEGSNVRFSVKPTQIPYTDFLGMLNVQHQFTGWTGDVASADASSSVNMDGPKTVQAKWTIAYSPLFFGFIGVIVGAPLVAVFLLYRRREAKKGAGEAKTVTIEAPSITSEIKKAEESAPPTKTLRGRKSKSIFCPLCGAKITRDSKFCKECGAKIEPR